MGPEAKVVVSLFIIAVLVYQWTWDLPPDSVLRRSLAPLRPRLRRLGLGHTWKLFAPRPPAGAAEMRFEIDGRDGRHYVLPFPLEDYGPGWGRPGRRMHKAGAALNQKVNTGYRRSFSRWLVDEYLPTGPARDRDWTGTARVRCITARRPPPPLDGLATRPPPFEHEVFDLTLPAP